MTKQELIGQEAFYMNPKNNSIIKEIRKLEDGKIIVYLDSGIIASADIVYLARKNEEVLSFLDKDF